MAEPIKRIERKPLSVEAEKKRDLEEIQHALTEHKTAILETIELLQGLHDRGILPLLNSLLAEGDKVLAIAMKEINKPQNSRVIENAVQLALMAGSLDLERLKPILDGVNAGLKEAAPQTDEQTSLLNLLKALRDPEVQRAVTILISFLKGMGSEMSHYEN